MPTLAPHCVCCSAGEQSFILQNISPQEEIATPPKNKSGGSQRHQFLR